MQWQAFFWCGPRQRETHGSHPIFGRVLLRLQELAGSPCRCGPPAATCTGVRPYGLTSVQVVRSAGNFAKRCRRGSRLWDSGGSALRAGRNREAIVGYQGGVKVPPSRGGPGLACCPIFECPCVHAHFWRSVWGIPLTSIFDLGQFLCVGLRPPVQCFWPVPSGFHTRMLRRNLPIPLTRFGGRGYVF